LRCLPGRFNGLSHLGTLAYQKLVALVRLFGKNLYLSPESLLLDGFLNDERDMVELERLGDKIVRALSHRLDGEIYGAIGSNHHDRKIPSSPADLFEHLDAGYIRHGDVQKRHLRVMALEQLQYPFTTRRQQYTVAEGFQSVSQDLADVGIIVSYKDRLSGKLHSSSP